MAAASRENMMAPAECLRDHVSAEINFTEKKHISAKKLVFRLEHDENGRAWLCGKADLSGLGLPEDARVYIEVRGHSIYERLDWGTVAAPLDGRQALTVSSVLARRFRLIVVRPQGDHERREGGLILAECPRLTVHRDNEKRDYEEGMLPIRTTDKLGEQLWNIDWGDDGRMELLLNSRVPGIKDRLLRDPLLQAAILPAAVALVLQSVLRRDERWDEGWQDDWRRWGVQRAGGREPPEDDEPDAAESWVMHAVQGFCRREGFIKRFLEQGGDSV